MNINKSFGKMDYQELDKLSEEDLSKLLEERKRLTKEQWSKEFVEAWAKDLEEDMSIVSLLQSNPDVEINYGHRKLYWDEGKWVVIGSRSLHVLYEGLSEQEAVKVLRGKNNV